MFSLIKKVVILVLSTISAVSPNCLLLKDQKCEVKKVIIDNDYITFPFKIKADRCIGSCNNKHNPYFKVCTPSIVKNISVKVFDLISQQTKFRNVSFHKSCKCDCLLDKKVCNNKQRWNKDKCRCKFLEIKECDVGFSWNVVNCRCEFKKAAKLITTEECDVETDISQNKTITLIKKIENCKPFVTSSILFVSVSVMLQGIMIHFCVKSRNKSVLPY